MCKIARKELQHKLQGKTCLASNAARRPSVHGKVKIRKEKKTQYIVIPARPEKRRRKIPFRGRNRIAQPYDGMHKTDSRLVAKHKKTEETENRKKKKP